MPKIGPRTYKIMWDTHSTVGIVIGLALFVLFFTGALLLFRAEIRIWEEPDLRASMDHRASLDALVRPVIDSLRAGDGATYLYMGLPDEHPASISMYMAGDVVNGYQYAWVNPTNGEWVHGPEEGALTKTLYYLHFFYQFGQWGLYLAGFVSLFALLAITTGTIVHFNRLVKDFFQFRPRKKLRVAWADAHKVLGTIGLPFQVMYALTGAYFGLVGLIVLPYAWALFDGNAADYYRQAGYYGPSVRVDSIEASGDRVSLEGLVVRAERAWQDFEAETMIIYKMGQPDSRVEVIGRTSDVVFGGTGAMVFHGVTGEELTRRSPRQAGAINQVVQSMGVLHFATFGGLMLKILFFVLAMASSAVIITGNLTWLEVRRTQDRTINRMLARLTAGVATGIVPATALLFLADRFMPEGAAHPGWWANAVFFGSWLLVVLYALARRNVARTHRTLLIVGGALTLLIPVANGLTTGDWPWVAWSMRRWAVLGVDAGAAFCGLVSLGIAACLRVDADSPSPSSGGDALRNGETVRKARLPEDTVLMGNNKVR